MLVLSRKKDESIIIDGNITVTVVEVKGNRIKLGISAPPEVAVHREETSQRIEAEERQRCNHEAHDCPGGNCAYEHELLLQC